MVRIEKTFQAGFCIAPMTLRSDMCSLTKFKWMCLLRSESGIFTCNLLLNWNTIITLVIQRRSIFLTLSLREVSDRLLPMWGNRRGSRSEAMHKFLAYDISDTEWQQILLIFHQPSRPWFSTRCYPWSCHLSLDATDMSLMTLANRTQLSGAFYMLTHEAHTSGPNGPLRVVEIACRLPWRVIRVVLSPRQVQSPPVKCFTKTGTHNSLKKRWLPFTSFSLNSSRELDRFAPQLSHRLPEWRN
jgi:hypothetical protein